MPRRFVGVALVLVACGAPQAAPQASSGMEAVGSGSSRSGSSAQSLRPPEAFAAVADPRERSRALFLEVAKVLFHPRCVNCHPQDDSPRQGDALALHDPPVTRGPDNHGVAAMRCPSCHQDHNLSHARVPGAPGWHLAPREMAWVGKTPGTVCMQIKDPARNGGKSLAALADHMAHDELVAWGWSPGAGRTPAPGTQAQLGALVDAWIHTGAECPEERPKPSSGGSR